MKDEEIDGGELVFALEGECGIESLDKMLDKGLKLVTMQRKLKRGTG